MTKVFSYICCAIWLRNLNFKAKGVVLNHTSEYYSGSLRHREAPRSTPNMLLQTWIFSWYKFCNGNHVIASVVNSTKIGARIVTENSDHHFQEPNEVCFTLQHLASLLSALQVLLQQPDSGSSKPSTPHVCNLISTSYIQRPKHIN